ncbi:AAA family ATPase [Gracilimonas sediminicola]|uniref:AAA family ATPase n=1 Tax=Gracilimonas sediminicola TaxID=2952158 RepID=UPI0038D4D7AE
MFKSINSISDFGVFKSYLNDNNLDEFSEFNIVYGWNYSGKTTISRIFQCLENNELHPDYQNMDFEVEDYQGKRFNSQNLDIGDYQVRVFNSDFVRENLHLEGEQFEPILLLGKENIEKKKLIEKKEEKIQDVEALKQKLSNVNKELSDRVEDGLTNTASKIKDTLQIVESFTKFHLRQLYEHLKDEAEDHILSEEIFQEHLAKATKKESDKLEELEKLITPLNFSEIKEGSQALLNHVPEFSSVIQYFVENPDVARWFKTGIEINKDKEFCEYCGSKIDQERIEQLSSHFSEDLQNHENSLKRLDSRLEELKLKEPSIKRVQIYPELREYFDVKLKKLLSQINAYNTQIEKIKEQIQNKLEAPFTEILLDKSVDLNDEEIKSTYEDFNKLISDNNDKTDAFEEEKTASIKILKKHYASKLIKEIEPQKIDEWIERNRIRFQKLEAFRSNISDEVDELKSEVDEAHIGSEKLNEFIYKFLGREEIHVVVEETTIGDRFRLKRNEKKAINLSEGERTAIAFSFFLTKLLELDDLNDAVVYIDDPISSLDGNHIFQINAMIKSFFFSKENPSAPNILNCKQLFISTHNFDFFSLLSELPKPTGSDINYYFIKRTKSDESEIQSLPKSIKNYKSEYHYLFKLIKEFYDSDDKDIDDAIILPNVVRRFVELYTYSRLPGNKHQKVDERADRLWGMERSKRILKVCHYFSHGNDIRKMRKHNEFINDIEFAVSDLIGLLEEDEIHFEELSKSL